MKDEYVAYVGTYTHGSSIGIHLYDVNVEEGTLTERKVIPVNNSSHIARSLNGKYLYSIADEGVAVFAVEDDGDLTDQQSRHRRHARLLFVGGQNRKIPVRGRLS